MSEAGGLLTKIKHFYFLSNLGLKYQRNAPNLDLSFQRTRVKLDSAPVLRVNATLVHS